jgi:hypothetical protein
LRKLLPLIILALFLFGAAEPVAGSELPMCGVGFTLNSWGKVVLENTSGEARALVYDAPGPTPPCIIRWMGEGDAIEMHGVNEVGIGYMVFNDDEGSGVFVNACKFTAYDMPFEHWAWLHQTNQLEGKGREIEC